MAFLQAQNLSITLSTPLFADLSFSLNAGDRLGLIAANGRGKSTLMNILCGEREATTGEVSVARGATFGVMEQSVSAPLLNLSMHEAIAERLSPHERDTESWRVDALLAEFETPETFVHRSVAELSGGWQRLMLLARAWINQPDILLLDEPTNHLDLEKILMLEEWLGWAVGDRPIIIASHDRAFLNAVTNRTLFIRPKVSREFGLPYFEAKAALEELDAADQRAQDNELKAAKRLRKNAAKLTNIGINSGSDLLVVKAKQLKDRASKIEDNLAELHKERTGQVKLANRGTHAKVLVALENCAVETPDGQKLFSTGKQFIFQGDRIVLLGRNGTGKTQLIRTLNRAIRAMAFGDDAEEAFSKAEIRVTPSVVLGYADQDLAEVPDHQTPLEFISSEKSLGGVRARAALANAGFDPFQQDMKIERLSYGQKSRLGLLALRIRNPNFYLLDEPTNHIDIAGQEALETELLEQGATCVLVSHDREFVRQVANRFWVIENKRISEVDNAEVFFESLGK